MANIRIKDLSTTAASTASDDFIAVDGATNGTRKLDAYSPTFGGNLTVNGTGTHSFNGPVSITGTSASNLLRLTKSGAGSKTFGVDNALDFRIYADNGSTQLFKLTDSGDTTITGNLTVSGGTITGGASGLSLASGGTNQSITLTPSGTGRSNAYGSIPSSAWAANDLDSSFNAGLVVGPRGTGSSFGVSTASASPGYPSGLLVDGSYAAPNSTVNIKAVGVYSGGGYGASLAFHTSSNTTLSEVGRFTKAGNLLIGTTTDGGQKLQVNGSAKIGSTSWEEFGTNGTAQFYAASGGTAALTLTSAGYYDWRIRGGSTSMTIVRDNTDMLSFDSSSNATFAGTIKPQQAPTASAPTYVKGAIYFDTTLNKLRVGGATGWETITSV